MRDILKAIEYSDLINGLYIWRKTTMNAKDSLTNNGCQGKVVECISKRLPDFGVWVACKTFIIKAIILDG